MKTKTNASPSVRDSSLPPVNSSDLEQFFADLSNVAAAPQVTQNPSQSSVSRSELEQFSATVHLLVEIAEMQQRRLDKRLATGFNVFRLIEPDENKLSDILANLLDPKGTHGQGDLFLRLLFKQLGLGTDATLTKTVIVQREAPTHRIVKYRRRIDILVDAGALLAIENKLDSIEQPDQVKDYLEHLRLCAGDRESCLIYLTPDGRPPETKDHKKLHCWSYQVKLRTWLEECRQMCEAQRICDFLTDFINYIASDLKRDLGDIQKEESDANGTD